MLAIDREHNLDGKRIRLQHSDGGAWIDAVHTVFPAGHFNADLTAGDVLTEEGAYLVRFPAAAARHWRLLVEAGGDAEYRPSIGGLTLGRAWQPQLYPDLPYSDSSYELLHSSSESDAGWIGTGRVAKRRSGEIGLKLMPGEDETARYHLEHHYARRRPMWIVFDPARADRAIYAVHPQGPGGFGQQQGWHWRQTRLRYVEHEPALS
jgi:hypothetical protein